MFAEDQSGSNPQYLPALSCRWICGLLLGLSWGLASSAEIVQGHSGTWWVPGVDGQGVLLEVFPEQSRLFFTWYTYSEGGAQRWLTGTGDIIDSRVEFQIEQPRGAVLDKPGAPERDIWGSGSIEFQSCTTATLTFQTEASDGDGVLNLERLTPDVLCGGGS